MADYIINNTTLTFDVIFYVNNSGLDTNDGLSITTSLKTSNKAHSLMTDSTKNYCIVFGNGTFDCYIPNRTTSPYNIPKANSISYIGNGYFTTLKNTLPSMLENGGININLNYYRLIFDNNNMNSSGNYFSPSKQINFYNVVILNVLDSSSSYMYPCNGGSIYMYNCVKSGSSGGLLRTTGGIIKLTNCYGVFTSGYSTAQTSWDYQTNKILSTTNLDSSYKIQTDDWQNIGTGLNNDGSIASIGVYGGQYAWKSPKYLIQQGTDIYSIKSSFYGRVGQVPVTEDMFLNNGVDDLSALTTPQTQNTALGSSFSTLGTGVVSSVPFNSDYLSIDKINTN